MAENPEGGGAFQFDYKNLRLNMPFRMQISGASGSGKTRILGEFIRFRDQMFEEKFHRIIYCYPSTDKSHATHNFIASLKSVCDFLEVCVQAAPILPTAVNTYFSQIHYGLPDVTALNLVGKKVHSLVILDDLGKSE